MSIDYKLFHFAAPPRTGAPWFIKAAQLAGLGHGFIDQALMQFDCRDGEHLRVSLVSHPVTWLHDCYMGLRTEGTTNGRDAAALSDFVDLSLLRFDRFVRDYLDKVPGAVSKLFWSYGSGADTVLRAGDLPWAFLELLESLRVPKAMRVIVLKLGTAAPVGSEPLLDKGLKRAVIAADCKVFDHYDYY